MEHFRFKLNGQVFEAKKVITGREILEIAELEPAEDYELLLKIDQKEFEPIQLGESVDLSTPGIEAFRAQPYKSFIVYVDDEPVIVDECFMTPVEILQQSGKEPGGFYLKQIRGHREITYKKDPNHKVAIRNKMIFSTCKLEPTTVS
ncbi:MAG: multiubiquitin domain-containing protein [Cytophagales bacterium]